MKTIGGVLLISIAFFIIWLGSAFLGVAIAFRAMGDSTIVEYLRMGAVWFICPGIGGYFAPQITKGLIEGVNIDSVVASFLTILTIIFLLFLGFSLWAQGTEYGGSVWEIVQLCLQFISMVIGTLIGKSSVKANA